MRINQLYRIFWITNDGLFGSGSPVEFGTGLFWVLYMNEYYPKHRHWLVPAK
jgi:hypothetical protein